ncbi:acyl-CoA thioesterase [Palleronia sediminis]|uniref:Acyl-CoA thioesterase n=1 Tax=Palleronia sediminis TaxID=2547833 RepID=A0A4R6A882_9RHOB|nr:acyl-CoA thioesterase [Palleronia sediminis]TDL78468.1 acyl-CoA thioesterase [Palleronia sediminis]
MYPYARLGLEIARFRRAPRLGLFDTHVSHHRCWPQDLDPWIELNNGRTLTLYDLGRIVLIRRTGIVAAMRREGWGVTVAGSSIRYRSRVRPFDRVEMRSRVVGWDARFVYIEQGMWRGATCCSHVLIRSALTDANGIVATERAERALGLGRSPELPDWIAAWARAEALRPWPPMQG